jgi:lysophospholipase
MKLTSIPSNPIPTGAMPGTLITADGAALRFAVWPGGEDVAGLVCLLQGRAEYIEKYFETISDLRARGFAVCTFDWRGQGLSQRHLSDKRKGYVGSFSEYDLDLQAFIAHHVRQGTRPLIALAHSMGATVLLRHLLLGEQLFDHVIMTAPMIALHRPRLYPASELTIRALNGIGFGTMIIPGGDNTIMDARPFDGNPRTSDSNRYYRNARIIAAEPELGIGSPTVAWAAAAFRAMNDLRSRRLTRLSRQSSLVVSPSHDVIVDVSATEELAVSFPDVTFEKINGQARHELLMERDSVRLHFWKLFDKMIRGMI